MDNTEKSYPVPQVDSEMAMEPALGYGTVNLKNSVLSAIAAIDDMNILRQVWNLIHSAVAKNETLDAKNDRWSARLQWLREHPVQLTEEQLQDERTQYILR